MKFSNKPRQIMVDEQGYLNSGQVAQLLKVAKKENERDYILLLTLAHSGRRISEVVGNRINKFSFKNKEIKRHEYVTIGGLKPKDIDFSFNQIYWSILKKPNTSINLALHREMKPESPILINALKEYIQNNRINQNQRIFKIGRRRADQIIKKYGEMIGLLYVGNGKIHCHTLRHSWGVNAVKSGVPILMIQKRLGHSSLLMTQTYTKIVPEDLRPSVNKVSELYA